MPVSESAIRAAFDLKVTFVKLAASQKIKIQDLTTWTALGMTFPGDEVLINFKVTSPASVTLYENTNFSTPDMDIGASDTLLDNLTFPNAGNGEPLEGTYIIRATIQYTPSGGSMVEYVITENHVYSSATLPQVAIEHVVDCIDSTLESNDVTNYPTNYTIDERVHTIKYPGGVSIANITTSAASYTLTPIYTGTFTTIITTTFTTNLGNGSYAQWGITGSQEQLVTCDYSLCDLYCCLSNLWANYKAVKGRNEVLANEYYLQIRDIAFLLQLLRSAIDCGKNTAAADYITQILAIAKCEPGCSCADGTPVLIVPLGGGTASDVVVDDGTGILVTANTSGGVTTYTVALAQTIIDFFNTNFIETIRTNTPDQISVNDSDPSNILIDWVGDIASLMSFRLTLDFGSPASVSAAFDLDQVLGPRFEFNPPTFATVYTFANSNQLANGPAAYKLTNFVKSTAVAKLDKVYAQIQKVEKNTSNDDDLVFANRVEMDIIKIENEEIWFRLMYGGVVYTHQQLINIDINKVYFHFTIIEGTP